MKTWSFYHAETGVLSGISFSTTDVYMLSANTPSGHIAIEGRHDPLSTRFDFTAKQIVDYQPPSPSSDHVWNPTIKRWLLSDVAAAKVAASSAARREIARLEQSQHRAVREFVLRGDLNSKARLQSIDDQIAALRNKL